MERLMLLMIRLLGGKSLILALVISPVFWVKGIPVNQTAEGKWDLKQLNTLLAYMNKSEDPCENFFEYACGNWDEHHQQERYTETTGLVDHILNKKLVSFFKKPVSDEYKHSFYEKALVYYHSCKAFKKKKLQKYLDFVRPYRGITWPILQPSSSPWPKKDFDWLLTLGFLRRYDVKSVLIEHLVLNSLMNGQKFTIDIDRPTLTEKENISFASLAPRILRELRQNITVIKKIYRELKKFEIELAKLPVGSDSVEEFTVDELSQAMPKLPWRRYLQLTMEVPLPQNFTVQFRNMEYFVALQELIENTEPEVVCNYIMIGYLYFLLNDGTSSADSIECVVDLRSKMEFGINFLYQNMFFQNFAKTKENILYMFETLRAEFDKKLDRNLLDLRESEVARIKEKLKELKIFVGVFPYDADLKYVNDYYKEIRFSPEVYQYNHLFLLRLRSKNEHAQLFFEPGDFLHHPIISDSDTGRSSTPFYLIARNTIIVPPGILQLPMIHRNFHDIFKMSLFGFLLAHELSHAFDTTGIRYSTDGVYVAWGDEIRQNNSKFAENIDCMMDQLKTDSIDERMADVLGIRIAFDALFGPESTLDSKQPAFTDIEAKQLFFLNFAQFFCGNLKGSFVNHDDDNVRVHQTLMNFMPFSEAFNCKLTDNYYPSNECRFW